MMYQRLSPNSFSIQTHCLVFFTTFRQLILTALLSCCVAPVIASELELTHAEQTWLEHHPVIHLGIDPEWAPFEYRDTEGQYSGMASDYIRLLSDRLGVELRTKEGLSWAKVIEYAKQGRLDVLPAVMKSDQREEYLSFTAPYLDFPMVIITRADGAFVAGLDDLVGKQVAVVRSYVTQDLLEASHPGLDLILVDNIDKGLQGVALGEVGAYVGNLAAITHAIDHLGLTNLKVAAPTPYSFPLGMGVRKDWPELVSILEKALASIEPEQARAIRGRWMSVQLEHQIDLVALAKKLAPLILAISVVFLVIIVWNHRLQREIEERRRVEEALRINEERLDLAMSVTNDGMFDWDLTTNNVYFSPRYYTMAGYEPNEFPGTFDEWAKRVHPEDFAQTEMAVKAYIAGEAPSYDEAFRFKRKEGEWVWIRARVKVAERDDNDTPLRMIGTHTDITEQRQAEQHLIAAKQEAERANQAKSEFLSRMSHELRTPLNAILGFSQLLRVDDKLMDEEEREGLKHISESGEHLLYLINEILDIARIDAQRMRFSIEDLPLDAVFSSAMMLVKNLALKKGVTIHALPMEMPWVHADSKRLKQIMVNLLSNAIKYNHEGGTVTITFASTLEGLVRINIIDTGIGIKPENQAAVFEPFYRIELKGEPVEGTGIGLSVVKKLVEAMDGRIGVKSEHSQGCTFWIELPQAQPIAAELADEDAAALSATMLNAGQSMRKILYIEDDPASIDLMQLIFKKLSDHELLSAPDAEQGLDIALEQPPDLILMDLDLPGMDGFEALEKLHTAPETADIPVIAVSAHAMPEHVSEGIKAGFIDYVTKPIQVNQLIASMKRAL